MTAYFVSPDADGDPILWHGGPAGTASVAVIARRELGWAQHALWSVLVGVLTEDAETVEKAAVHLANHHPGSGEYLGDLWERASDDMREVHRLAVRCILRALRGGA